MSSENDMSTEEVSSDEVRVEIPFSIDMSSFQARLSKLIPVAAEKKIFAKTKLYKFPGCVMDETEC